MGSRDAKPLSICLITDVFPPASGGSGWSTYYLGKALSEQGHRVRVLRPIYADNPHLPATSSPAAPHQPPILLIHEVHVPPAPLIARKLGIRRAWQERTAARLLSEQARRVVMEEGVQVLHAQHMVSALAASAAVRVARRKGSSVVTVATIRDYWPICPTSTRLFADRAGDTHECRDCHKLPKYLACAAAGGGEVRRSPLVLARWLRTARSARSLASLDAVIAVSRYVRNELAGSGRVPRLKLAAIPNMVDLPSVDHALKGDWPLPGMNPHDPFLLFVGKWDHNKGAHLLPRAIARSGVRLPVVLAGEGPLRERIEAEARGLDLDFRFYPWLDNDSVILLMHRARALLFPSAWAEPLSRVLLEGCAASGAIVALNTGGTGDIIAHMESGWLAENQDSFAEGIAKVSGDLTLNMRLRLGARERAERRFASPKVSARVEALYRSLIEARGA